MSSSHFIVRTLLTLFVGLGLSACQTSSFVLPLDLPKGQKVLRDIRVASVGVEDAATATLQAVKVYRVGGFSPRDLNSIEQALRETIAPHATAVNTSERPLDVHLVVRRYMVATSNNAGAVLVNVTWAMSGSDGKPIYQEQFFASDAVYLLGTPALLKDSVHKAMIRRIATISLALASGTSAPAVWPSTFEKTYLAYGDAIKPLPQNLVAMGNPGAVTAGGAIGGPAGGLISLVGVMAPSGGAKVRWNQAQRSGDFDWPAYLQNLYAK